VEAKLRITKQNIEELPRKPEGDPVAIVWKLLEGFKKDVAQLISGRPEDGVKGLIQIFRASRGEFKEAIFRQAPDFKPYNFKPYKQSPRIHTPRVDASPRPLSRCATPRAPSEYEVEFFEPVQRGEMLEPTGFRDAKTAIYLDEVVKMAQKGDFLSRIPKLTCIQCHYTRTPS
jgi:hypothetical protein